MFQLDFRVINSLFLRCERFFFQGVNPFTTPVYGNLLNKISARFHYEERAALQVPPPRGGARVLHAGRAGPYRLRFGYTP